MKATAIFFLSAVTDEFRSYRESVRAALDRPGVRVETQETFLPYGDTTLIMLDNYIRQCDAVIHLAGQRTGSAEKGGVASKASVDGLLAIHGVRRQARHRTAAGLARSAAAGIAPHLTPVTPLPGLAVQRS